MMGLGAMTYWAKQTVAGTPLSDDPSVWAVEALDWSGVTGWLMDANNVVEKATRGHAGLSAVTGEQMSRYQSRNVTNALLGPTVGGLTDIFQVSGAIAAGDLRQSDIRAVRRLLPMQNLFYIRTLLDQVEHTAGTSVEAQ